MEKTIAQMEADLASLWAHADKFLKLAGEHAAAGNSPIAKKLTAVGGDLLAEIASLQTELSRARERLDETV
jgi:hypothetical protein